MKLSEVHQKLLETTANGKYAKGYIVPEGEEGYFHIMFVDILKNKGGRSTDRAVFQKYFPAEWQRMMAVIENPNYTILATGHNEYAIVHDPTIAEDEDEIEYNENADQETIEAIKEAEDKGYYGKMVKLVESANLRDSHPFKVDVLAKSAEMKEAKNKKD